MSTGWYRAHGLTLASEVPLPELAPAEAATAADLVIRTGDRAALAWRGLTERPPQTAFAPAPGGGWVMHVDEAGTFLVTGGREIAVTPAPGADAATVRLYLLGSAIGMALHQRHTLVLHAAGVVHGGRATLVVGESGSGKSTLAAALGRAGHPILGDDTIALRPDGGGGFVAFPGSRMWKLWADAITALDGLPEHRGSVGARLEKFFVPAPALACEEPVPVGAVVALADGGDAPAIAPLGGLAALRTVAENTYRPEYVPLLGWGAEHFRLCSALAGAIPVFELRAPRSLARLGETVALLESLWTGTPASGGAEQPA